MAIQCLPSSFSLCNTLDPILYGSCAVGMCGSGVNIGLCFFISTSSLSFSSCTVDLLTTLNKSLFGPLNTSFLLFVFSYVLCSVLLEGSLPVLQWLQPSLLLIAYLLHLQLASFSLLLSLPTLLLLFSFLLCFSALRVSNSLTLLTLLFARSITLSLKPCDWPVSHSMVPLLATSTIFVTVRWDRFGMVFCIQSFNPSNDSTESLVGFTFLNICFCSSLGAHSFPPGSWFAIYEHIFWPWMLLLTLQDQELADQNHPFCKAWFGLGHTWDDFYD